MSKQGLSLIALLVTLFAVINSGCGRKAALEQKGAIRIAIVPEKKSPGNNQYTVIFEEKTQIEVAGWGALSRALQDKFESDRTIKYQIYCYDTKFEEFDLLEFKEVVRLGRAYGATVELILPEL